MVTAQAELTRSRPSAWVAFPRRAGWALLVCWSLLLGSAFFVGERPSTLLQLDSDVASGEARTVRIVGDLSDGGTGFATVEAHWRRGMLGYSTTVIEARPRRAAPRPAAREGISRVITEDLAERLTAVQPGLRVVRVDHSPTPGSVLGWSVPGWLVWAYLLLIVTTLALLVYGPEPRRATRWGWFWLLWVAPVGAVAYLLLGGPTSLVRAPGAASRRLTGGWAFLLTLFVGSVVGAG